MTDSLSVFLVEDESLIRMMMADMVQSLGHHVVAEADNIQDASAFAMTAQYDLAILDINLMGVYVDPVADLIERRGKPFLFATGYGPELLPSLLRRKPILRKPISIEQLRAIIAQLFPSRAGEKRSGDPRLA
jgi:CheY-like chemotaxis protein